MEVDISIVIPAFNEERRLPRTLALLLDALPTACPGTWEIIVSDDGSSDRTAALARQAASPPSVRVVSSPANQGKGAAAVVGIYAASNPLVLLLDADLPVPVETIPAMIDRASAAPLVLGSRRLPGASVDPPQPVTRRVGGKVFRLIVSALGYRVPSDPQCGVKLLRRDLLGDVLDDVTCRGFAFDVELIERTRRHGMTVVEMPVAWSHVEGSSLHPFRDAVATLRELVCLRRDLRRTDRSSEWDDS